MVGVSKREVIMSHDVYFCRYPANEPITEMGSGEFVGWLKVNGCEQALQLLLKDEELYDLFYNRSHEYFFPNKEEILTLLANIISVDWRGKNAPEWVIEQISKIKATVHAMDYPKEHLAIHTI